MCLKTNQVQRFSLKQSIDEVLANGNKKLNCLAGQIPKENIPRKSVERKIKTTKKLTETQLNQTDRVKRKQRSRHWLKRRRPLWSVYHREVRCEKQAASLQNSFREISFINGKHSYKGSAYRFQIGCFKSYVLHQTPSRENVSHSLQRSS